MSNFDFVPQGWECPKCKRVYSPQTMMCIACPQYNKSETTTNTPIGVGGFGTTSTAMLHNFQEGEGTSKTKCKICGREKLGHPLISYT